MMRHKRMEKPMIRALCRVMVICAVLGGGLVAAEEDDAPAVSPPAERIAARTFPSVFQAWNTADNLRCGSRFLAASRHDLIFHAAGFYGLKWDHRHGGLATGFTPDSIERGLEGRRALLALNPNVVLLMEIRYRDAHRSFLPEGHEWWRRDEEGALVMGGAEGGIIQLDFSNPDDLQRVTRRAEAAG